jgi:hypothetical protein
MYIDTIKENPVLQKAMEDAGYKKGDMVPVAREDALKLYDEGMRVYMLCQDMEFHESILRNAIKRPSEPGALFAVEKTVWDKAHGTERLPIAKESQILPTGLKKTVYRRREMVPISGEDALKLYDDGMRIYTLSHMDLEFHGIKSRNGIIHLMEDPFFAVEKAVWDKVHE